MKIAVDGIIIEGSTHVKDSFITGEAYPSKKEKEDKVLAGSMNIDGYIEYKAQKIGKDSTISQIVKLVVEATASKAPIAKIADKISRNICTSTDINCNYNIYSLYNIRI